MGILDDHWITDPFFVNPEGTKFWHDEDTTKYMAEEDQFGITLEGYVGWFTETKNGERDRIIVDNNKSEVVYGSQSWESVLVHIDIMKMSKKHK